VKEQSAVSLGPERSLVYNLMTQSELRPTEPAIFYYGTRISYLDLWNQVERLATYLVSEAGVGEGDRVAIDLQNSPQFVAAYYAILLAGAIVVPLNPMYRAAEVEAIIGNAGVNVVFAAEDLLDRFGGWPGSDQLKLIVARYADALDIDAPVTLPPVMTIPRVDLSPNVQVTGWQEAIDRMPDRSFPGLQMDVDAAAVMPYTSGSTGVPKGCLHAHRGVMHTAVAQADWYQLSASSVVTAVQPLFHVAGMQGSMNASIYAGAALLILTRWDADVAIALFARHGVTFWNAPPTMVVDMLSRGRAVDAALARIAVVTGGGAAMPDVVSSRLKTDYGVDYIEAYGLSETMSPSHMNPLVGSRRGTIGIPIQNTLSMIVDPETLAPLADGEVGEIVVSGPQVMRGYWNNPKADADAFFEYNGRRFLRTGDLGARDADGFFRVVDRLKRMINASGFKVWPTEVEGVLFGHEAVQACCVVASPDPYRGETVKAIVQLAAGKTATADELTEWLRSRLAAFKLPRSIAFVDELPLTASHKIDWRQLQEREKTSAEHRT
jgi:fatty-acyl-CoA synthase